MAEGLAASMVYGNGSGNTVKHYYDDGKSKTKGSTMACKKTKPGKK